MSCCTFWDKFRAKCKAKSRKKRRISPHQSPLNQEPNTQRYEKSCLDLSSEPSTASVSSAFKFDDPWTAAEEELRKNEKTRVLLEDAFEILQNYGLKIDHGDGQSNQQLTKFLNDETRKLEEKKWTIADHCTPTRDQLSTIFKNILMVKEIFTPIASVSSSAAIACAGLTVVFTLFIQYMEQKETLMQGIQKTAALIPRIHLMGKLALEYCSNTSLLDLMPEYQQILINLCSKTLEFHARALRYLEKSSMTQISRDMVKKDSWDKLLKDMEDSERDAQSLINCCQAKQSESEKAKWDLKFTGFENKLNEYQVWEKNSAYDKKVEKLLHLLYTCPYRDRKDRNYKRVLGTCEWFTQHQTFQEWDQSEDSRLLWVSADPGCGKSVLAKYLVDKVLPRSKDRTVCYFFFKDDFEDQRYATAALSNLIRQLLLAQPSLISEAILKQAADDGEKLTHSFQDLWDILTDITRSPAVGEIVFVIDALDECQDADRRCFIDSVTDLYLNPDKSRNLKFLMTSRPYSNIEDGFHQLRTKVPTIRLSGEDEENIEKIAKEINLVVQDLTKKVAIEKELEPEELEFLQKQLAKIPNRTYLWVTLTLDYIAKTPGFTKGNVRRCLSTEIPPDVNQAYEKILNRSTNHAKARLVLHIILAAKTPLSLGELSVSLAVNGTNQSMDELKEEMEPSHRFERTLRGLCGLMLHLNDGKVYLLHQTVKEFLVANTSPKHSIWQKSFIKMESDKLLAERCVWFLQLGPRPYGYGSIDFAYYARTYWSDHFRGFPFRKEDEITNLALQLCDPDSKKFQMSNKALEMLFRYNSEIPEVLITPLMAASSLGLESVVQKLLSSQSEGINLKGGKEKMPPISFAAQEGHHAVVKLLFETGLVNVDLEDEDLRTPLLHAARNGHEATVRFLLKPGLANIKTTDRYQRTLLSYAAQEGHHAVVELLLTESVVMDPKDINQRTPLSYAASSGKEAIVKLLLDTRKVDVKSKDKDQRTPLSWAVSSGSEATVRLLLLEFVTNKKDVNEADVYQRTPLLYAVMIGHEAILNMLLSTSEEGINTRDKDQRTPLSYAAASGNEAIVKRLLDTDGVGINLKDKDQRTPLSYAAASGNEAIVKRLLDTNGVNVSLKDKDQRTSLSYAAASGNEAIVKQLLDTDGVDINLKDKDKRTPLSWAVSSGSEATVRLLLELDTENKDVDEADVHQRTPLSYAAQGGHEAIVNLLLKTGKVNADSEDDCQQTPLSYAAQAGHEAVVERLLKISNVIVDSKDILQRTPLSYAADQSHQAVAKLLLDTGLADVNWRDNYHLTPFMWAVQWAPEAMIRLFLDTGEVELNTINYERQNPLSYALIRMDKSIIDLLLEFGAEIGPLDHEKFKAWSEAWEEDEARRASRPWNPNLLTYS